MHSIYPEGDVPNLRDETLEKTVWYDPDELNYLLLEEREHTHVEIDRFQRTIYDYNSALPIVTDEECHIVAGRGRVDAARLLGIDQIPTIPLPSFSSDDLDHYIETMIRFGAYVGWTSAMLQIDLQHLLAIEAQMKAGRGKSGAKVR